jgi:hypothetical protein
MLKQTYYQIGNSLKISVRSSSKVCYQIDLHLRFYRCESFVGIPDILIDSYDSRPDFKVQTVVDDYYYGEGFYHRAETRIQINMKSDKQLYFMDNLSLPIDLIIQIGLLKKRHTFVHGAGVNFQGNNILFPAYPGTGKTATVASLMNRGGKLFGDDLCILGKNQLYPYPQNLTVYSHHLPVLGYTTKQLVSSFRKARILGLMISWLPFKSSIVSRAIRFLLNYFKKESVDLDPKIVFGEDSIAKIGLVDEVIFLERSDQVFSLEKKPIGIEEASSLASSVLWHEWHNYFHDLFLYDAMSSNGVWFKELFSEVEEILKEEFSNIPLSIIKIPASWDNSVLVAEMPKILNKGEM